ncbi:unnamed protein product, partial [Polarella glacialis]
KWEASASSKNNGAFGFVTYHKSGNTLTANLVGVSSAGPLVSFLFKEPSDIKIPHSVDMVDYGEHVSVREGRAAVFPFFQAYVRTYRDLAPRAYNEAEPYLFQLSSPVQAAKRQLQEMMAAGAGRMVHLVRKPSDMLVSGYRYHSQRSWDTTEVWEDFKDPPSCLSCDHQAWLQIFGRRKFLCSYGELMRNVSVDEGLEIELLRSRWDIMKMVRNVRSWYDNPQILQISLENFVADFEGTLLCIGRFLLNKPPPEYIDLAKIQRLLNESRDLDIEYIRRKCQKLHAVDSGARCHDPFDILSHASSGSSKKAIQAALARRTGDLLNFLGPADSMVEAAIMDSATAAHFGCPRKAFGQFQQDFSFDSHCQQHYCQKQQ